VPCSLDISRTKTLAKVAQRFTKKNPEAQGVLDLTYPSNQTSVFEETPVGDVGPTHAKMLKGAGIDMARKLMGSLARIAIQVISLPEVLSN
jgi:DNA polymerase V